MYIRMSKNNLRRTIFTSLYALSKVFICKACISHIDKFKEDFVIKIDFDIFPFHNEWIPFLLKLFLNFWLFLIDGLQQLWLSILHLRDQLLVFIYWSNTIRLLLIRLELWWFLLLWLSLLRLWLLWLFLFDFICITLCLFVLLFKFFLFILWILGGLKIFKILHTDRFDFICLDLFN